MKKKQNTPPVEITPENIGQFIYERMAEDNSDTYESLGKEFGLSAQAARGRARRYQDKNNLATVRYSREVVKITGAMNEEPFERPESLWQRALEKQERNDRRLEWKQQRRVIFEDGPVVLVFMADLHLGSSGTDYRSIDYDMAVINNLAEHGVNVAVVLLGDMLDNFIVGRLRDLRMNQSPFLTVEEWGLVDYALERLSPFLIGSVAGNHDNWSWAISGIDLLRQRHNQLSPGILYDPLELTFMLQVGEFECRIMCRHKWRGSSMFNPTHGLEHGHHKLGRQFDIGVAAHTHRGGLAREFANGKSIPGHALICGSYKKDDTYAMAIGYPPPLDTSAVAVVIDTDGIAFSTSRLDVLGRFVSSV